MRAPGKVRMKIVPVHSCEKFGAVCTRCHETVCLECCKTPPTVCATCDEITCGECIAKDAKIFNTNPTAKTLECDSCTLDVCIDCKEMCLHCFKEMCQRCITRVEHEQQCCDRDLL